MDCGERGEEEGEKKEGRATEETATVRGVDGEGTKEGVQETHRSDEREWKVC